MIQPGLLTTPRELAHNPSGASSQPLGSKRTRGCGLSGKKGCVLLFEPTGKQDRKSMFTSKTNNITRLAACAKMIVSKKH